MKGLNILFFCTWFILVAACSPNPSSTPTIPAPSNTAAAQAVAQSPTTAAAPTDGTATLTGRAISSVTQKPYAGESIRLAEVFYADGNAHYILDSSFSPAAVADRNGNFVFTNVPPKEYIITVGEFYGNWKAFEVDGAAKIFDLTANQVVDAGVISVDLTK